MFRAFGITSFVMDSGERRCLVVDRASGLPLYYPNLFLTTQVRNRGLASATVEACAAHLVVLLRFLDRNNIGLESRVHKREFLRLHELDALRDFTQKNIRLLPACRDASEIFNLEELEDALDSVNTATQYARLSTIADYLKWFSEHVLTNIEADDNQKITALIEQIRARRPVKKNRNEDPGGKSLSDEQLRVLLDVARPGSELNPFKKTDQQRNYVIVLLMYHLGIRGGELLNIRIEDIRFEANILDIVRRPDDPVEVRSPPPLVKTLERSIPIGESLISELYAYITTERQRVKRRKDTGYLILTHKAGPTFGLPLSKAGYYKIISVIRSLMSELNGLSGHSLRHTWNRRFSEQNDAAPNPVSPEMQEQVRSYVMGWSEGSGTAAVYNKRFVQKKAYEAAGMLQQSSGTRLPKKKLDE